MRYPRAWAVIGEKERIIKQTLAHSKGEALQKWYEWLLCRGVTMTWKEWEAKGFKLKEVELRIVHYEQPSDG